MLKQNARRTGAAGVIARALGTLGAATLLLTSTGWGALAGDTGFGAVNPMAYQGAATGTVKLPPSPPSGSSAQTPAPGRANNASPTSRPLPPGVTYYNYRGQPAVVPPPSLESEVGHAPIQPGGSGTPESVEEGSAGGDLAGSPL